MAKRNGRSGRNLPAKLPSSTQLAGLRRGNPGHDGRGTGRNPDAVKIRALALLEKAKGLEVAARIIQGEEYEPRVVDKEIIHSAPMNRDKLAAAELLLRTADVMPRAGVTVNADGPVTVQVWRFGDRKISF